MSKTFDISTIRPTDRKLEITRPGSIDKIGLTLTVMSLQDDRMKQVKRTITDKMLARRSRNKTASVAEIEQNQREICLKAVTEWEWGLNAAGDQATFNGDQPEFSQKALSEVLTALPWVVQQIDEFISDEAAFFQE